jgi:hypothetical protein
MILKGNSMPIKKIKHKNTLFGVCASVLVVAVFIFFYTSKSNKSKTNAVSDLDTDTITESENLSAADMVEQMKAALVKNSAESMSKVSTSEVSLLDANRRPVNSNFRKAIFSNVFDRNVVQFSETAKIETNFPVDFEYQNVKVEGMPTLVAKNDKAQVVIVSSVTARSDQQILAYLSDPAIGIAGLENLAAKDISKQKIFKPNPDSGLSSIRYIYKETRQSAVAIAVVERADGRGQYISIISGEKQYMDKNEDRFENIIKNLRAR